MKKEKNWVDNAYSTALEAENTELHRQIDILRVGIRAREDIINKMAKKKRHWETSSRYITYFELICSGCGKDFMDYFDYTEDGIIVEVPNYCPNCGAEMNEVIRGENDD